MNKILNQLLDEHQELNLNNYGDDDVRRLNDWATAAFDEIKALEAQLAHVKQKQLLSTDILKELHHIEEFGLFCSFDEFEQIARTIENEHGIRAPKQEQMISEVTP